MARLKRHHLRNPPPVSSDSEHNDAVAEDNAMDEEIANGGAEPRFPARSLSDSDIEGTPPSPSISGFIIEPIRSAIAREDSAVKPKRSSARSASKRLSEQDVGDMKTKKKKSPSSAADAAVVAGGRDQEIKKSSGAIQRVWSEEDEIAILKGVIEYRAKTGSEPSTDAGGFLDFIKDSIHVEASKAQLMDKVRKLKKKFRVNSEKCEMSEDPVFTKSHDSTAFQLSKKIWGKTEPIEETMIHNNATGSKKRVKQSGSDKKTPHSVVPEKRLTLGLAKQNVNATKKKKLANLESENGVEPVKERDYFEDLADAAVAAAAAEAKSNPEVVDDGIEIVVEKGWDGKENGGSGEAKSNPEVVDDRIEMVVEKGGDGKENGGSVDAFWVRYPYLKDALETMVSQGVMGDFEKRLLLEKDGIFEGGKGKEWDEKWKAFRFEEIQLHIKRQVLLAELLEAALDELKN